MEPVRPPRAYGRGRPQHQRPGNRKTDHEQAIGEEVRYQHLDADSTELLIANREAMMKRAKKEKDVPAVLTCAKAIVEAMGDQELTDEDEELLNRLLNATLVFAKKIEASFA